MGSVVVVVGEREWRRRRRRRVKVSTATTTAQRERVEGCAPGLDRAEESTEQRFALGGERRGGTWQERATSEGPAWQLRLTHASAGGSLSRSSRVASPDSLRSALDCLK